MDVRPATAGDLPAIVEIYNHYVLHTPVTFDVDPYTVEARRPWFEQFAGGRHRLLVGVDGGRVIGYAGSMRHRPKAAYDPTVETTVYVAHDAHRRGAGRGLYEALFAALGGDDVHRAVAGITVPNDPSVRLHEAFGFRHVGVFTEQGRKLGRWWDVTWFEKAL